MVGDIKIFFIHAPSGGSSFADFNCQYPGYANLPAWVGDICYWHSIAKERRIKLSSTIFAASIGMALFSSEVGTEDIIKWAIT